MANEHPAGQQRRTVTADDTAWLRAAFHEALAERIGPLPGPVADAAGHLVATCVHTPERRTAELTRFASTLGDAGWDLGIVAEAVRRLAELLERSGRRAMGLVGFEAGLMAGRGWANGYLPSIHETDTCTDPVTGLTTIGVLAWRLHQVYDQCAALEVDARQVFTLVMIEVVPAHGDADRDAGRVAVAEVLRRRFRSGETVTAAGHRMLVLASSTQDLEDEVEVLLHTLRCDPELADHTVLAWVEDLPGHEAQIERYLFDLL